MAKIGEALSSFINTIAGYKSTFKDPDMEQGSIAELMAEDKQKEKETGKPGLFQRIQEKVAAFFASNVGKKRPMPDAGLDLRERIEGLKEKKPMPSNEGEFDSLEGTTKAADRTAAAARITQGLSKFEENTQGMERGSIAALMASGAFDDED